MLARIKAYLQLGVKQGREGLQHWGTRRRRQIVSWLLVFLVSFTLTKVIVELVTEEIAIFGFHDIIDVTNPQEMPPRRKMSHGDYTKQNLEELLDFLVKNNYWFLSTQDLYDYFISPNPQPIPEERKRQKRVMVTVDDGYQSAHDNIFDLAQKLQKKYGHSIEIVWFVNPPFMGKLGRDVPSGLDRVSCEDFREGLAAGFYDLQSHGANHTDLTELNPKKLDDDLSKSQNLLRECTQDIDIDRTVANHIAYPFGAADDRVENAVKKYYFSGYNYSNKTLKGTLKNPYQIPRVSIHKNIPPQRLIRLAKGGWI